MQAMLARSGISLKGAFLHLLQISEVPRARVAKTRVRFQIPRSISTIDLRVSRFVPHSGLFATLYQVQCDFGFWRPILPASSADQFDSNDISHVDRSQAQGISEEQVE